MKWPSIPRPWNPAYTETYDAMTEAERQNSFKIDLALVAVVILFAVCLGGCNADPGTGVNRPTAAKASGGTSTATPDMDRHYREEEARAAADAGTPVLIDRTTGCQYLRLYGNSMTPRMSRIENGKQYQVGCYVEDVVLTSPVP